jgi:hypothetical protein
VKKNKTHKPRPETKNHYTTDEAIKHLRSRVIITESGCHEWQGPRTKDGYGQLGEYYLIEQFGIKLVHRLMVHLTTGHEFADRSEQVMHSCHNRSCCNPDHLSIGTAKENMRQAVARQSWGSTNRGEANHKSILSEDDVREIRRRYAAGDKAVVIAKGYPISERSIYPIVQGLTWRHIL